MRTWAAAVLACAWRKPAFALLLLFAATLQSVAQDKPLKGVALVIGNGDYEHIAKLPNPVNDARAIEAMLDRLGFETTLVSDRNARRLKRDLDAFAEDAEGADVAVLYYSGHGIEAGGENFLVPVDADVSSLGDAGAKLVPLGAMLEELKASVPVTIVLLDACRSNPFPADAVLKLGPTAGGQPVTAGGLGATRGAAPMASTEADATRSVGTVIGFAAEPGRVALDGPAGGNSPYAAAILRHLDAMDGQEFGTVMRLVAEEVYLKTGGRQQPWVNESLRRLLYFGAALPKPTGADGEILVERRSLLLTIAALPEAGRRRIETIAATDGVPMDALYGMLAALGADVPNDPAELERVLAEQSIRVKYLLAERDALKNADPEIARLAALSDQAVREGALNSAIRILGEAKARVKELDSAVDQAEDELRRRRVEFAAVYGRSAEAHALAFDFLGAADDFALAFEQVEKWDDRLAWTYRRGETEALISLGNFRGDKQALARAIGTGEDIVAISRDLSADEQATSRLMLGNALQAMGERDSGSDHLDRSVKTYREALDSGSLNDAEPAMRAKLQNNLANTLATLGRRKGDKTIMLEAVEAYRAAIDRFGESRMQQEWGLAHSNLGKALLEIGEMEPGVDRFMEAGRAFETALTVIPQDSQPIAWATIWNNMGNAYFNLGDRSPDSLSAAGRFLLAVASYQKALIGWDRVKVPAQWAVAQGNLANAFRALAFTTSDTKLALGYYTDAEKAQRAALEELTRERGPLQWAITTMNLGRTLYLRADRTEDAGSKAGLLAQASKLYQDSLQELTKESVPLQFAIANVNLGQSALTLAYLEKDQAKASSLIHEAEAAQRAALEVYTAGKFALARASTLHDLGYTLITAGEKGGGLDSYRAAEAAYREEDGLRSREVSIADWAKVQAGIGNALRGIGLITRDRATLDEAKQRTQAAWDAIRPITPEYDGILSARLAEIEMALTAAK